MNLWMTNFGTEIINEYPKSSIDYFSDVIKLTDCKCVIKYTKTLFLHAI